MASNVVYAHDRDPRWKWNRATAIVNGLDVATTPHWDSQRGYEWISRTVDYIRSWEANKSPYSNPSLITLYGDIFVAHNIFTDTNSFFKDELEATILAHVDPLEISAKSGTPAQAIIAYQELFFDVADRLDQEMYIVNYVIGKQLQNVAPDDYATLWKLFGYFHGPEVLRAVIHKAPNPQPCSTPDTVVASMQEDFKGCMAIAASIVAKNPISSDPKIQNALSSLSKYQGLDRMADAASGVHMGQITEHLTAMLAQMEFTIGGKKSDGTMTLASRYNNAAVYPTLDDYVEIALTGTSDRMEAHKNLRYPPITKKQPAEQ